MEGLVEGSWGPEGKQVAQLSTSYISPLLLPQGHRHTPALMTVSLAFACASRSPCPGPRHLLLLHLHPWDHQ